MHSYPVPKEFNKIFYSNSGRLMKFMVTSVTEVKPSDGRMED